MASKVLLILCLLIFCIQSLNQTSGQHIVKVAKISYYSRGVIQKWQCNLCGSSIADIKYISNEEAEIQGFVGFSKYLNSIIISIRGPTNIQSWLSNFDAKRVSYPYCQGCQVNQGFYKLSQLIFDPIKLAIQILTKKYQTQLGILAITLTGHSLGGAISTLVGSRLISSHGAAASLTTFGSPRIGNKAFAVYVQSHFKECYRVVYGRDSIPHLPIRLSGYVHVDKELWFQFLDKRKQCKGDKSYQCSNSVSLFLLKSSHHYIDKYVEIFNRISANSIGIISNQHSQSKMKKISDAVKQDILIQTDKSMRTTTDQQQMVQKGKTEGLQGYKLVNFLSKNSQLQDFILKYDG